MGVCFTRHVSKHRRVHSIPISVSNQVSPIPNSVFKSNNFRLIIFWSYKKGHISHACSKTGHKILMTMGSDFSRWLIVPDAASDVILRVMLWSMPKDQPCVGCGACLFGHRPPPGLMIAPILWDGPLFMILQVMCCSCPQLRPLEDGPLAFLGRSQCPLYAPSRHPVPSHGSFHQSHPYRWSTPLSQPIQLIPSAHAFIPSHPIQCESQSPILHSPHPYWL